MAKAPTPATRTPVAERGAALMALIAASDNGTMMLTQDEALDLVNNGFATVDTSNTDGDTAAVTLTDAGKASLVPGTSTPSGGSKFEIETGVEMPTARTRRGRSGGYPFDQLPVGGSFHVPATADEPNPEIKLSSSVSAANSKYAVQDGDKTETKTIKSYAKDDKGAFIKDANGKRVVSGESEEERPVMVNTREFQVRAVDENDPKGKGARVWRTA